jgi:hypothetical protein
LHQEAGQDRAQVSGHDRHRWWWLRPILSDEPSRRRRRNVATGSRL